MESDFKLRQFESGIYTLLPLSCVALRIPFKPVCTYKVILLCVLPEALLVYCTFKSTTTRYSVLCLVWGQEWFSSFFFIFKIVLTTLGPLYFHKNFRVILPIQTQTHTLIPSGLLTEIILNIKIDVGRSNTFMMLGTCTWYIYTLSL